MKVKQIGRTAAGTVLALSMFSSGAFAAPAYLMGHDALYTWDYHLTNYDEDGNIRVSPEKTTFALPGEAQENDIPDYYSPDAVLYETNGNGYGVSGEVVIMFDYMTESDKAWVDAIDTDSSTSVQLVSYDENKNTLNDALQCKFEIGVKSDDNLRTVAKLTIPLGQTNFYSNGRYYVRVRAQEHRTALVPIHVVNDKAPTITPQLDTIWPTEPKAYFDVSDMVYGILIPPYAAELTYPDGSTHALTMIDDWYLIGDLFILYNDDEDAPLFTYNGTYTLTVHSNGFKDMSCQFQVENGIDIPQKQETAQVDAVSRATGAGGSGGSSGIPSYMPANLIFDEDLLSNAQILNRIGYETDATRSIDDRWNLLMEGKHDTVYSEQRDHGYDWSDYIASVQTAKGEGKYLTFEEYMKNGKSSSGNPYAIKEVLEDGLLGETQMGGVYLGKRAPEMTLLDKDGSPVEGNLVTEGNDLVLRCADPAYLEAITGIMIDENQYPRLEAGTDYQIEGDMLTIFHETLEDFGFGAKRITIDADEYRRTYLNIVYGKNLEQNVCLEATKEQFSHDAPVHVVVKNTQGDFLDNLQTVELVDPNGVTTQLYTKEQGGDSSNDWYTLTMPDRIGIMPGAFKMNGTYTVRLTSEYYGARTVEINMTGSLPAFGVTGAAGTRTADGDYQITLQETDDKWRMRDYTITVNGTIYGEEKQFYDLGANQFRWDIREDGRPVLYLDPSAFTGDVSEIIISLKGYEPLRMLVKNANGYTVITQEEQMPTDQAAPAFASAERINGSPAYYRVALGEGAAAYLDAIGAYTKVTVANNSGTTPYTYSTAMDGDSRFTADDFLNLSANAFETGDNVVTVSNVGGYQDLSFTVTVQDTGASDTFDPNTDAPTMIKKSRYYELNYSAYDLDSVKTWLGTITGVTVNGTVYTAEDAGWDIGYNTNYLVNDDAARKILLGSKEFREDAENTLVLSTSDGDLTLKITSDLQVEIQESEDSGKEPPTPSYISGSQVYVDTWTLSFDNADGKSDFFRNLSDDEASVTINGAPLTETNSDNVETGCFNYYAFGEELYFNKNDFVNDVNEVKVQSPGYQTLTFYVTKDGVVTMENDADKPSDAKTPPAAAEIQNPGIFDDYYRLKFDESFGAEALDQYLSNESIAVTVDGNPLKEETMWWNVSNAFRVSGDSEGSTPDMMCFIDFSTDCFEKEGNYNVVISVPGYEDLTLTVVREQEEVHIQDSETEEANPAPIVSETEQIWFDDDYKIGLQDDAVAEDWIPKITSVTVNGTSYSWKDSGYEAAAAQWKQYGSSPYSIRLGNQAFQTGQNVIRIEAEGYETLVLTINDRGQQISD